MAENFDLLGDPIPENFGGRGRPPHIPTQQNRSKVMVLLGLGWTNPRIAQALRITGATLRKHYFRELRARDEARPALEAARVMMVYDAARKGNVGAMKELGRVIDTLGASIPVPGPLPKPDAAMAETKPAKLGKKAAAETDAKVAHKETSWGGLLDPDQPVH